MMKSILGIVCGLVLTGFFSSCSTTMPLAATSNSIASKQGVSSNTCVLGYRVFPSSPTNQIISNGLCFNKNYGVAEAAEDAGIEKVATVDLKITNYVIFLKWELIVTGE